MAGLGREPTHACYVQVPGLGTQEVVPIYVERGALWRAVFLVTVLVQEHGDLGAREVLGTQSELYRLARGEVDRTCLYGAFALFPLIAVLRRQNPGAEYQDLGPLAQSLQCRVAIVGVEVVEKALQIRVAPRVIEDSYRRGVLGLGGDDVADVKPLGFLGFGGPKEELVGRCRKLLARYDPSYRTRAEVQKLIMEHL
jgi:hypothetical protein